MNTKIGTYISGSTVLALKILYNNIYYLSVVKLLFKTFPYINLVQLLDNKNTISSICTYTMYIVILNISTFTASFCVLLVNPPPFLYSQTINPFLNSIISTNHEKRLVF